MADIYKEQLIIPENLPEILSPPNNNQAIIVEKELYGAKGFRDTLDVDFSELTKSKKQNIKKFFIDYEELFYDIPEEGKENTHRYILETSGEYLEIFESRDKEIEELKNQLSDVEEELEECKNPEDHPFYPNGSVLSADKGGSYYFMERGKKRNIVGGRPGQVWKTLKLALGFKESDDDYESNIVKATPRAVLEQIKSGPALDLEDIGGGLEQSPKAISVKLDPTDHKANPDLYGSIQEYKVALEAEIIEAWDLERNMETLHYKYANDAVNSYTSKERASAKANDILALEELKTARRKLAAYKIIYQSLVAPSSQSGMTIAHISMIYDTMTRNEYENISDNAIRQFVGWEKGKSAIDGVVGNFNQEGERGTDYY